MQFFSLFSAIYVAKHIFPPFSGSKENGYSAVQVGWGEWERGEGEPERVDGEQERVDGGWERIDREWGEGNAWALQNLYKRKFIYRVSTVYQPCINRVSTVFQPWWYEDRPLING